MLYSLSDPPEDTRGWGGKAPERSHTEAVVELQIEAERIFSSTLCSNL